MIDVHFHFDCVKHIETGVLKRNKAGFVDLCVRTETGNGLTIYFDDPEQIQILVNALADLFLKMSAKTQVEQSNPDSADGIKPILIEQIEQEKTNG